MRTEEEIGRDFQSAINNRPRDFKKEESLVEEMNALGRRMYAMESEYGGFVTVTDSISNRKDSKGLIVGHKP